MARPSSQSVRQLTSPGAGLVYVSAEQVEMTMALRALQPNDEMSQKEFWISAYLAALHRVGPAEAVAQADQALELSNQRWCHDSVPPISACQYLHNYPVGYIPSRKELEDLHL